MEGPPVSKSNVRVKDTKNRLPLDQVEPALEAVFGLVRLCLSLQIDTTIVIGMYLLVHLADRFMIGFSLVLWGWLIHVFLCRRILGSWRGMHFYLELRFLGPAHSLACCILSLRQPRTRQSAMCLLRRQCQIMEFGPAIP